MNERPLPLFGPGFDPGPSFAELLRRTAPPDQEPAPAAGAQHAPPDLPHGTTVVAIRFADGVVLAGDRRATSGFAIANRRIEKVFPADDLSGVAIAGVAGPGTDMVRLFQTQLEHYEKIEGEQLSLEGKANQLSQMVRSNLPAAMQGLAVVPLFAGYDLARGTGRLFEFDVTGGRYEENDHASTGSGSLHAGTVVKLGWKPDLTRDDALALALKALFQAADEDSATGGPDLVRGIYPTMATITAEGFTPLERDEIAERFRTLLDSMDGG